MIHAREDYMPIQDPRNKIGEDEPVFLLRAQDENFIPMLEHYKKLLSDSIVDEEDEATEKDEDDTEGMSEEEYEAFEDNIDSHIALANDWQEENGVKTP